MSTRFTDAEIEAMLTEIKHLPVDPRKKPFRWREKRGHKAYDFSVVGESGKDFKVAFRQSNENPLDFSVILSVAGQETTAPFRLRRYNGKGHEHGNRIEKTRFYDFHIHMATERYQDADRDEDTYAEATDRYSNLMGAPNCLLADRGFLVPDPLQAELF